MSLISRSTDDINGKIATAKVLYERANKKNPITKSGVNNLMDSILEIFNQLGGYNEMIETIENTLSSKLDDIEETVKSSIKISIKNIINCSIEPKIQENLIVTGVTFGIKSIDPNSILSTDPESKNGSYVYSDVESGLNSKDFNVFLYKIVKESVDNPTYTGSTWVGLTPDGEKDPTDKIFSLTFKEYDEISTPQSNVVTIKIDENYSGETLSYFISNYLDSVKLFNNSQVLSKIFDEILGTKIVSINKTSEQISAEKLLNMICENILNNANDDDVLDDSYYTFSNDVYNSVLEESERKSKGYFNYVSDTTKELTISDEFLMSLLSGSTQEGVLISEQTVLLKNAINQITEELSSDIDEKDKYTFQLNIIKNIIKKLMITITSFIFSPKVLYLFVLIAKIFETESENTNMIDFIKNNKNLYQMLVISIRDIIMKELTLQIIKMITPLIQATTIELAKERMGLYKMQIEKIRTSIDKSINAFKTVQETIESSEDEFNNISDKSDEIKNKII